MAIRLIRGPERHAPTLPRGQRREHPMTQEKTPDENVPAKTDDQHLEADLTDEELTAVAGGRTIANERGMLTLGKPGSGRGKTGPGR